MRTRGLVMALLALAACGKSSTKSSTSNQGTCDINQVATKAPSQSTDSEILGACVGNDGALSIAFVARNAGQALTGLTTQLSFTAARLVQDPSTGPQWQSYVNKTETPPTTGGPFPSSTPANQATTEATGTLTEKGNGIYTYAYATNLKAVTTPIAVPYDASAVHRVGLEMRGQLNGQNLPVLNPVYTWKPDGSAVDNSREIVTTATCNQCHAQLAAHGGARTNTDYCVTCHNPGSVDAESGNSVDFKVMIHKIHAGADLPSVQAGGKYVIYGFQNSANDFSTVVFPQPVSNCRKCHSADIQATPQGAYWQQYPAMETCGSCHDNVSFASTVPQGMIAHPGGPVASNQACSGCHSPDEISEVHAALYATSASPAQQGTPTVKYQLSNLQLNDAHQPVVTFAIIVNGSPADLSQATFGGLSFANPDNPSATVSPRIQVAWRRPEGEAGASTAVATPSDNNTWGDPGSPAGDTKRGQPRSKTLSALVAGSTHNADGSYTTAPGALGVVPADATHVTVGLEGLFYFKPASGDPAEEIGGDSAVVATTDPPRRQIVSLDKCNVCHDRLNAHGGNRANNIQICVMCHNPNATDRGRRPTDPNQAVDKLQEQAIDFREMIHKIHTGENLTEDQYVIYGFATPTTGRPVSFKDVRFPGNTANCLTCHLANTFTVPIDQNALATTKLTGDDQTSPNDDTNVSPTGAACTGCHDQTQTLDHAHATLTSQPSVHGTQGDNCSDCHGAGKPQDVSTVHQLSGQ